MKLIDKDVIITEIENIRKHYIERDDFDNGWNFALDKVLSFLDTLEVKEVDLDAEIMKYQREIYDRDTTVRDVAKHFFELGMQVSNKAQKGE